MISMDQFSDDGGRGTYHGFDRSSDMVSQRKTADTVVPALEHVEMPPWAARQKPRPPMTRAAWPLLLQAISNTFDSRLPEGEIDPVRVPTNLTGCLDDDDDCFYCGSGSRMDVDFESPFNSSRAITPSETRNTQINYNSNSWNAASPQTPPTTIISPRSFPEPAAQNSPPFYPIELISPWPSVSDSPLPWPSLYTSPLLPSDPRWQHSVSEMRNAHYPFAYSATLNDDQDSFGHVSGFSRQSSNRLTCNSSNKDEDEEYRPRSPRGWESQLKQNSQFSKVIERPRSVKSHEVPESPRLPALGDDFDDDDEDEDELEEIEIKSPNNRMGVDAPVFLYQPRDMPARTVRRTDARVPSATSLSVLPRHAAQPSGRPSRAVTPPPLSQTLTPQSRWKLQMTQHQHSLPTRGTRHPGFPPSPLNPNCDKYRNKANNNQSI